LEKCEQTVWRAIAAWRATEWDGPRESLFFEREVACR
jgi:hypothetical protein